VGVRDARYLNWRWRDHPVLRPVVLAALDSGRLNGYIVMAENHGLLEIRDVFPFEPGATVDALLTAAIQHGWRRQVSSISMIVLSENPLLPLLESRGFRPRPETSEAYVFAPDSSRFAETIATANNWFMTSGDRDL
jgi:hypothetical protein